MEYRKTLFALVLVLFATPSLAQYAATPNYNGQIATLGPYTDMAPHSSGSEFGQPFGEDLTPSTKAYRLTRASELRTKAIALQQADGGTLTPSHRYWIRRQYSRIFGSR